MVYGYCRWESLNIILWENDGLTMVNDGLSGGLSGGLYIYICILVGGFNPSGIMIIMIIMTIMIMMKTIMIMIMTTPS